MTYLRLYNGSRTGNFQKGAANHDGLHIYQNNRNLRKAVHAGGIAEYWGEKFRTWEIEDKSREDS